ncbi:MAG: GNAT family N-acetyltransferase [Xanthomonadales bacterium]|nr:GNAT family N-acetyltransferase [Xanthomonadales bacterium]
MLPTRPTPILHAPKLRDQIVSTYVAWKNSVAHRTASAFRCRAARSGPAADARLQCLREFTFRAVGEGSSGKRLDLDRYDAHYDQLVLWDERLEVAGVQVSRRSLRADPEPARHLPACTPPACSTSRPELMAQLDDAMESRAQLRAAEVLGLAAWITCRSGSAPICARIRKSAACSSRFRSVPSCRRAPAPCWSPTTSAFMARRAGWRRRIGPARSMRSRRCSTT